MYVCEAEEEEHIERKESRIKVAQMLPRESL